jgi:hypothetical protein
LKFVVKVNYFKICSKKWITSNFVVKSWLLQKFVVKGQLLRNLKQSQYLTSKLIIFKTFQIHFYTVDSSQYILDYIFYPLFKLNNTLKVELCIGAN